MILENQGRVECDKCHAATFQAMPINGVTARITEIRRQMRRVFWRYCRWQGRSSDLCPACYAAWEKGGRL